MPKVTKSVKKNQPVANPYMIGGLKASYPGTPLKDQGYSNKVETVATAVPRVYVTSVIRPEGNGAAYTKPMKEFFESKADPALMADWNCHGFKTRRAYDAEDPKKNEKMPGMKKATWPWDCLVTIADSDDETAESIGNHIAAKFTEFTEESDLFTRKQLFTFKCDASEQPPAPLSRYILDDDVIQVLASLFEHTNRDDVLQCDSVLEAFFGDAEHARDLLHNRKFGTAVTDA